MNTNYPYDDVAAPPPGWAEPFAPAGSFSRGASPGSRLLQRVRGSTEESRREDLEARSLMTALAARGIHLHLVGDKIKWTTNGVDALTIVEMRGVKRLGPALWNLLEAEG